MLKLVRNLPFLPSKGEFTDSETSSPLKGDLGG